MAALFSDHSALESMTQMAQANVSSARTDTRYGLVRAFWATPARPASATVSEVLEVTFTGTCLINWLKFDLAKFPQSARVEYFNNDTRLWTALTEKGGLPLVRYVHKSVPAVIPLPSTMGGHKHPQHSFSGHWQSEWAEVVPTTISRLRVILTRQNSTAAPRDVYGKAVDYGLAVRNLSVGYQVTSRDDIPRTLPSTADDSYRLSFATTDDVVSSSVEFSLRSLDAARVLDEDEDLIWRCEPQPDPSCVVSLYADLRTPNGDPQVFDRIFLDPLNTGAHVTVYCAQDVAPTSNFLSPDSPVPAGLPDLTSAAVTVDAGGMHFGSYPGTESMLLDNAGFGYDPSLPWWVGIVAVPHFDPAQSNENVIFDCGVWRVALTGLGVRLEFPDGVIDLELSYQNLLATTLVISWDGTRYGLWASNAQDTASAVATPSAAPASGSVSTLSLGSDLWRVNFGQCDITRLVIHEEKPPADPHLFAADPDAYCKVLAFPGDEPDTSRLNAILRFSPTSVLVDRNFPWGLFGGVPDKFESMRWTPISRDYTMARGWMILPPTLVRYVKLEFTQLQATYADVYLPTSQRVRKFPSSVLADFRARRQSAAGPVTAADEINANLSTYTSYDDAPNIVSTGGTGAGYTNTEVYVADDLAAAARLYANQGENWSYQQLSASQSAPRFYTSGVHVYASELVNRVSKVAYQVGLRSLRFARSVFSAQFDTPRYEEMFYDVLGLDTTQTTFSFDAERFALTSALAQQAQVVSRVLPSNRTVRGVQFAAQQSPPTQVLVDAEFDDRRHPLWHPVGNAVIGEGVDSPAFGQLVPVSRVQTSGAWEDIAPQYGTWDEIESTPATYAMLGAASAGQASDVNGIVSELVPLPGGGYLYCAARVWVDEDLFSPLYLQIVDSVTNLVLAEESVLGRKGQVIEWSAIYPLGSTLLSQGVLWSDLDGSVASNAFSDSFIRANANTLGQSDSGQVWTSAPHWNGSPGEELSISDNLAAVTGAGQRSVLDLGTDWGTLVVQLGSSVFATGSDTAVPLIDLGGPVLLNDGRIIDPDTGYTYVTIILAASDTLRFDYWPTAQVPTHPSGADASLFSWSLVVTRNSTWVTTISTTTAFVSTRGLSGAPGQRFTSFAWTPKTISTTPATTIASLPMPRDGSLSSDGFTWTQNSDGRLWSVQGAFTVLDTGTTVQPVVAPAGLSFTLSTDVREQYGALSFAVTTSDTTPAANYYVALLDDVAGSQLYLRADGALVRQSAELGTVVLKSAAVPGFSSQTTVLYARTADLSSLFRGTYGLTTTLAQTLVFINGTTVTGTYQGDNLWGSGVRGVMGSDGSRIAGFSWSPNLGSVSAGVGQRTWNNVSANQSRNWSDIARDTQSLRNPVRVRVVQKSSSHDVWYMDSLAAFLDPIVWEFSNDAGVNWVAASTVRNNPLGVALFETDPLRIMQPNRLCYRVTSYAPDTWLSHLVIRPWYTGYLRGVPVRGAAPSGPNLNPLDDYADISEDPSFMVWSSPIPREWFFAFRSVLPDVHTGPTRHPAITERIVL